MTLMTASDKVQPALIPLWQGADGASGRSRPPRVTDDRELEFSSFNERKIAPVSPFPRIDNGLKSQPVAFSAICPGLKSQPGCFTCGLTLG